jgi:hypothetical protein
MNLEVSDSLAGALPFGPPPPAAAPAACLAPAPGLRIHCRLSSVMMEAMKALPAFEMLAASRRITGTASGCKAAGGEGGGPARRLRSRRRQRTHQRHHGNKGRKGCSPGRLARPPPPPGR